MMRFGLTLPSSVRLKTRIALPNGFGMKISSRRESLGCSQTWRLWMLRLIWDLVAGKRQRSGIAETEDRHVRRRNLDRALRTRARAVPISCIELDRPMLPV